MHEKRLATLVVVTALLATGESCTRTSSGLPAGAAASRAEMPTGKADQPPERVEVSLPGTATPEPPPPRSRVAPFLATVLVVDEHDQPVADAVVTFSPASETTPEPTAQRLTDDRGVASMWLDLDFFRVSSFKKEIGTSCELLLRHDPAAPSQLRLIRTHVLHGRLLGADGTPVAAAEVYAMSGCGRGPGFTPETVVTDHDGRFACTVVRNRWTIFAVTAHAHSFCKDVMVTDAAMGEVLLTMPGAISVSGTVYGPDGRPVGNANVGCRPESHAGDPDWWPDSDRQDVATDAHGRFSLFVPDLVRYQVFASAEGMASSAAIAVQPNEVRPHLDVALHLRQYALIRGRVIDANGRPAAFVWLDAGEDDPMPLHDPNACISPVRTKADGTFAVRVRPGACWTLRVRGKNAVPRAGVRSGSSDVVLFR